MNEKLESIVCCIYVIMALLSLIILFSCWFSFLYQIAHQFYSFIPSRNMGCLQILESSDCAFGNSSRVISDVIT